LALVKTNILYGILFFLFAAASASAQNNRNQLPRFLQHAYFGVDVGYIHYPFSNKQMEAGYQPESIHIPHAALRITLLGYHFNKFFSGRITYLRPVNWVEYKNINHFPSTRFVRMNEAGLTLRSSLPLKKRFSVFAEGGVAVITRRGFDMAAEPGMKDANFLSLMAGGGFQWRMNNNFDLDAAFAWSPQNARTKQPHTVFYSAGFSYSLRKLSTAQLEKNSKPNKSFSHNIIQFGWTTNAAGYGINNFFSKTLHIFWAGEAQVANGFSFNYQRNIFHTKKVFSWDWGTGISYWQSRKNNERFFTIAAYPVFRFTVFRLKPADIYFDYSLAGPAFISKTMIDDKRTGEQFTFQDFMGMGIFAGKKRSWSAELRIAHYSNGNIFPQNDGVMIPLSLNAGYSF
jgi:hypothetical protein